MVGHHQTDSAPAILTWQWFDVSRQTAFGHWGLPSAEQTGEILEMR